MSSIINAKAVYTMVNDGVLLYELSGLVLSFHFTVLDFEMNFGIIYVEKTSSGGFW